MGIGISHAGFVCSFLDAYEKLVGLDFEKKEKKEKERKSFTLSPTTLPTMSQWSSQLK